MNLEDLKREWQQIKPDEGPELPPAKIRQMIRSKYRRHLWRILLPEALFALVYGYFVLLILAFYEALNTDFLASLGGITIVVLVAVPFLRFFLLRKLYGLGKSDQPYGQALREFTRYKLRFLTVRKAQAGLGFLILTALFVLVTRIYGEPEVASNKYYWAGIFSIGLLAVLGVNHLLNRHYRRSIGAAEAILKELR